MKTKLKRFLRNWVVLLLPFFMLRTWLDRKVFKRFYVIALTFHDVPADEKYKFDRVVRYLHKRFPFLTPEQFEDYQAGRQRLSDISLLITFDDGFSSSRQVTSETLEPLGIKAVFFCCSDFIGMNETESRKFVAHNLYCGHRTEAEVNTAELAMSQEEMNSLAKGGHLIAAHTQSHLNLGQHWPAELLQSEIVDAAHAIEKQTAKKVEWFAFPFGGISFINAGSLAIVQKHFKFCFSGIRGSIDRSSHPMALPRQSVTIQDPYLLQLALFYGATNWLHRGKLARIKQMALGSAG